MNQTNYMEKPNITQFIRNSKLEYEKTSQAYKEYKKRFIYTELKGRMIILYGMRGTGKTTLMFQKYLETNEDNRIYLHGEELSILRINILDAIKETERIIGQNAIIFLDEINTISNWDEQIKIAYDKYPKMLFYISGSSSINLLESKKLLARRAIYISIPMLSFREFIYLKYNILLDKFKLNTEDILRSSMHYDIYIQNKLKEWDILKLINEYIQTNSPYLLENNKSTLADLVEKAIFSDIAKIRNIETSTLSKFERLILILSASTKTSYETIAKDLGISKSVVSEMLDLLEKVEIIKRVYPYKKGKTVARKQWKYYFTIPIIRELYTKKMSIPESELKGNMREDIFVANFEKIFYHETIDFVFDEYLIEIGSKNKTFKQFKEINTKLYKIIIYEGVDIIKKEDIIKMPFHIFYSII